MVSIKDFQSLRIEYMQYTMFKKSDGQKIRDILADHAAQLGTKNLWKK